MFKLNKTSTKYSTYNSSLVDGSVSSQRRSFFKELMKDAAKSNNFQSKLIKDYYLEISIPHMKKLLKSSIVILIIYIFLSISFVSVYKPNKIYFNIGQSITMLILLGCLASTFYPGTYKFYIRVALVALMSLLLQNMLSHYDINSKIEIAYSPIVQIVVLSFSFIPINYATSVSISILTICFLLAGTSFRIENKDVVSEIFEFQNDTNLNVLSDGVISIAEFKSVSYIGGQIFLWISVLINSCYMFTCNRLWRRSAFLMLHDNLQRKKKSKNDMKAQLKWIEAIMPRVVKDEYLKHYLNSRNDRWIYIKQFTNVSILFADIVGFTNMSSNKTAPQVVTLLNDLFNRFDDMCELTNCEKLGTLGDCYYCVAGCPKPRSDHAVSCVEMGLGMCRIIKRFNEDHRESVNMRVGVHTGTVNAAILGTQRFRFDVYSYDVILANTMESSGEPGRVHISEPVRDLIRNAYNVEPGKDLEIMREEDHGIRGIELSSSIIKTFFVDPKSSHLQKRSEKFGRKTDFQVYDVKRTKDESSSGSEFYNDDNPICSVTANKKSFTAKINKEVGFIEMIKYDPDHQVECLNELPINFLTLKFSDPEIEWHYQVHTIDHIQYLSLCSAKSAAFVECLVSFVCTVFICLAALFFFSEQSSQLSNTLPVLAILMFAAAIIVIEFWKSVTYNSLLNGRFDKCLYSICSHQIYRSFVCVFMTSLPNMICLLLIYSCQEFSRNYYYQARYFSLSLFSLINGSLYISACSPVKLASLLLNFLQCISFGWVMVCDSAVNLNTTRPFYTCLGIMKLNHKYFNKTHSDEYLIQYLFTFIVLILLVRDRERNLRTWFYVTREAEIEREGALRAMISSQEILYNIIPRYVFTRIKSRGENLESGNVSYALAIQNCAVVFGCISNFFSKYYREDYKGGETALKLLHTIITKFDNILLSASFKDVEKIKTINDCYMVASGLNTDLTADNTNTSDHLVALMKYAFEMQRVLTHFNDLYIIGSDKFLLKIGYNIGPVTAGIIGSTKPMYDIWGDTVNVSSRMYSTGKPGEIQVPFYVVTELKTYFEFKYRGKIFVKGKGDMDTYLCLRELTK